ncbi:S26 family signal peptidase [Ruegeria jejuensis]|uniref:S26 family signal peptidase n=1 Tax=Ruegeria jejuensis TaxID=3233338 RepID=UPI00355B7BDA
MRHSKAKYFALSLMLLVTGYYFMAAGRIGVNATDSMTANGFVMVTWPKPIWHGAIVATRLPKVLAGRFEGKDLLLTKRVVGVAGDPVRSTPLQLCVRDVCAKGLEKNGRVVAPIWQGTEVPEGTILVFGESPDSLDSR